MEYTSRDDLGIGKKQRNDSMMDLLASEQHLQHGFASDTKLQEKHMDSDTDEMKSPSRANFESQRASFSRKRVETKDSDSEQLQSLSEKGNQGKAKTLSKEEETSSSISSPVSSPKHENVTLDSLEKDMKTLMKMIDAYKPENFEMEPKLQPFTPDYIPCIGDIDPMIKVA
jgi:intraflagellar transport protein 46